MAGIFELFTDSEAAIRFRLLGSDGTVLATSERHDTKRTAAAAITMLRECAATGHIRDECKVVAQNPGSPAAENLPATSLTWPERFPESGQPEPGP